ncbi:protein kish-B isoform 2-T2 [Trichechus inunguis]
MTNACKDSDSSLNLLPTLATPGKLIPQKLPEFVVLERGGKGQLKLVQERCLQAILENMYSLDGILVFGLLFVCTCAYFKKVPRLKSWLLSEKKGVWGVFYKAAVIGTRLHVAVAVACVVMAFYVLFIK